MSHTRPQLKSAIKTHTRKSYTAVLDGQWNTEMCCYRPGSRFQSKHFISFVPHLFCYMYMISFRKRKDDHGPWHGLTLQMWSVLKILVKIRWCIFILFHDFRKSIFFPFGFMIDWIGLNLEMLPDDPFSCFRFFQVFSIIPIIWPASKPAYRP